MRLAPLEKLTACYLLSGPQTNRIGIYVLSHGTAAEDLGLKASEFSRKFANVLSRMSWKWLSSARMLYIPAWWSWNQPENLNVLRGALKDVSTLPKCELVIDFLANDRHLSNPSYKSELRNLRQTLPQTFGNSVTVAVTVTEAVTRQNTLVASGDGVSVNRVQGLFELYNANRGFLPESSPTESRMEKAKVRLRDPKFPERLQKALAIANATPFLRGEGDRSWKPNLDWFLANDRNVLRVLEGQYGNPDVHKGNSGNSGSDRYAADRNRQQRQLAKLGTGSPDQG